MTSLELNYQGVFDRNIGFGQNPALLIIDFINAYVDESSELYAPDVKKAVAYTAEILPIIRKYEIPIIFTKVLYNKNLKNGGLFVQKIPSLQKLVPGEPLGEIVDCLEIQEDDIVLEKQYASCFFGTSLSSTLHSLGIDTIILTGCSTSGCVRATAVDGIQHGFRVIVPKQCVGDRHQEPHEANLFDIAAKYGDVVELNELITCIQNRFSNDSSSLT